MPATSRLTLRGRKNRRRPASLWARLPKPGAVARSCGRVVRRSLPALAASAALVGLGTGAWLGYRFVTTSPRFAIEEIRIDGTARLAPDELRATLPVALGDNVFTADLDEVTRALRAQPWIADARVHRVLPDTLVIDVREHVPAAVAVLGEPYLVDAAGRAFKRTELDGDEAAGLPVVTGIERTAYQRDPARTARTITAALADLARWREGAARPAVAETHVGAHDMLTLRTADGAAIQLGPVDGPDAALAARMRTFDVAWAELTDDERARARAIHLDARPAHVTVAFKD